ncbi:hypothetical protein BFW41_11120 [Aeromonas hydrophila]|uniref:hypothetical protein n=1 Tax=Aeromonas TaxID=642 RepID=UPI000E5952A4|nr:MULTISPECIES: hypothetical protein [Aeromonas]AXV34449.1 hypothetical protein BFW41_11120 [Aeromonas hydrophila]EHA1065226.1 hypothetical protein [Aeromonas hydrophila]MBM0436183.1 hypothetical protein [Aeromonas hydrophila subsp. ranae]MBW3826635.1 hypothetical protein [Aeromonas hydrophila]MCX4113245.1 hypothetical protein [Aeromonas hydrophila]
MKERLTSRKIVHLAIVLAILLGLVAYRTWFGNVQTAVAGSEKDQICDLSHSSCPLQAGNKPLIARIASLPVQAERDFVIQLQGGEPAVTPVKAWLEGRDMFMGTIPVNFEATEQGWQGTTLVGSCTSPMMVWLLNIEWSNGQRQQLALSVAR